MHQRISKWIFQLQNLFEILRGKSLRILRVVCYWAYIRLKFFCKFHPKEKSKKKHISQNARFWLMKRKLLFGSFQLRHANYFSSNSSESRGSFQLRLKQFFQRKFILSVEFGFSKFELPIPKADCFRKFVLLDEIWANQDGYGKIVMKFKFDGERYEWNYWYNIFFTKQTQKVYRRVFHGVFWSPPKLFFIIGNESRITALFPLRKSK